MYKSMQFMNFSQWTTGSLRLQGYMIRKLDLLESLRKRYVETIPNRQSLMICVPCECLSKSDPSRESFL